MRVLMLGWDFAPRRSGGVGSACQGLATALARKRELGVEVLFVLPSLTGDEEPGSVRLLSGADLARRTQEAATAHAPEATSPTQAEDAAVDEAPEPELEPEPATEPQPARPSATPDLPTPAEALRLLRVASPLRPYLAPADYAREVETLMSALRPPATPTPRPAPARKARVGVRSARAEARTRVQAPARTPRPALDATPLPEFALTLGAEVERYAREVLALVQGEDFDLIHAHDWMSFPAALLLAERRGKPLVVHFHSCERERRGEHALEEVRAIEQAAITAATRVLAVSRRSADTLEREYAIQPAKLRVLHNALSPLPQVQAVPDERRTVLYAGRLSLQKGPDVFLEAAARVHARLPDLRFVLAGEGTLYPELAARARKLGLEDAVEFTGFLDGRALAEAHARAAAFVMPSRSEPFGLGALEALALGVPTIVSDDAGVNEVVRSVLRFEPGNVGELADKLIALLSFPALASELSRSGLVETRRLRWDRPARTLAALYSEVVA